MTGPMVEDERTGNAADKTLLRKQKRAAAYAEAAGSEGIEFEEFGSDRSCVSGVCGV